MSAGTKATRSWADVARGKALSAASCVVDGEVPSSVISKDEADAEVNAQPWGSLTQRVASALAPTDDEVESDVESMVGQVAQQDVPSWPMVANPFPQRLVPAPLGSKLSPCRGEVLAVFGHYGWLTTSHQIAHPAAERNGGRIYFHAQDVMCNVSLVQGDRVDFYLYVDEQGLGAEELSLQRWDAGQSCAPVSMNPAATEFVPRACSMPLVSSIVAPPLNGFILNAHLFDDSDSDDSDSDGCIESEIDQRGYWTDGSDTDSSEIEGNIDRRGNLQRKLRRKKSSAHSNDSSSTGPPSDSEMVALEGPPPGLLHPQFRPPPGLTL